MIDWRGNEYDVGDIIAYPTQRGRSIEIIEAEVLEIGPQRENWNGRAEHTTWVKPIRSSRFGREHKVARGWAKDRVALRISENITLLERAPMAKRALIGVGE